MAILVFAEHDNSTLKNATLKIIAAARAIDDEVDLLVAGQDCAPVATQAAQVAGLGQVFHAESAAYAHQLAENIAPLLVRLAPRYSHILAAATTNGKNTLPRAAALLDVQQISDVCAIVSADTFTRPIYAGNALATVRSADPIKLLTIRTTAFKAVADTGGAASIEKIDAASDDSGLSQFIRYDFTDSERPELTTARVVISGGRALQSKENFVLLERVADKLGAAVGASRSAVDAGYAPNDYQVGQTGKVVAPELYIAVGISGAIQHLAGMKDSQCIVAINKDEDAPIFQYADYGLVADLFDALPELEQALS